MQNYVKTILSAFKTWTQKKIKDSTADWNENDSNKSSYVKNRTHWEEEGIITLVDNLTNQDENWPRCDFIPGQLYTIIWNGIEYKDQLCINVEGYDMLGDPEEDLPFYIDDDGGNSLYISTEDDNWALTITTVDTLVHKIPQKYLELPDNIATTDDVDVKMDKTNPVGTGSFSINRREFTPVGDYSFALGLSTEASARSSFVLGEYNIDSAFYKMVEEDTNSEIKYRTDSSGIYYCSKNYHFDELTGFALISPIAVSGEIFKDIYQNYIGYYFVQDRSKQLVSRADKGTSLVKITENTKIYGHGQGINCFKPTVQLLCEPVVNKRGSYISIVGNGANDVVRSNAHTLDWEGNAWYSGDVYVGSTSGTNRDEGSKRLVTMDDVKAPKDYIMLTDISNGCDYIVYMKDGNLVSSLGSLDDFTYTTDNDGNVTLTGWKQTLYGKSSTEMIVPDDDNIIL